MHITADLRSDSCCRHILGGGTRSGLCAPLSAQGETLDMLNLQQRISSPSASGKSEFDEPSEGIDEEVQQLAVTVADMVLRDLGRFLQSNIRKEDVACQYGGEEFTLILPGVPMDITEKRAETLRCLAQNLELYYNGKPLDGITLSPGAASFPEHGATGEAVLQAADAALYTAKHTGRNKVSTAGKTKPTHTAQIYSFSN